GSACCRSSVTDSRWNGRNFDTSAIVSCPTRIKTQLKKRHDALHRLFLELVGGFEGIPNVQSIQDQGLDGCALDFFPKSWFLWKQTFELVKEVAQRKPDILCTDPRCSADKTRQYKLCPIQWFTDVVGQLPNAFPGQQYLECLLHVAVVNCILQNDLESKQVGGLGCASCK